MRGHASHRTTRTPMRILPGMLGTLSLAVGVLLASPEPAHAQIGTWNAEGRVKAIACLGNECASDSQQLSGTATILEDGTYRSPNLGGGCLGEVPDEEGVWRLEGHNRIVFETTNIDDIVDAVLACYPGVGFELRDYTNRAKLKQNGQLLKGKAKLRARVTVQGQHVAAKAIWKWTGTPVAATTVAASRTATPAPMASALAILLQRLAQD